MMINKLFAGHQREPYINFIVETFTNLEFFFEHKSLVIFQILEFMGLFYCCCFFFDRMIMNNTDTKEDNGWVRPLIMLD